MSLSKKPYKGCRDFFPSEMRIRNYIFDKMHESAKKFNYLNYDGPTLEEVELYKAKSGEELINDQIYSFEDRGKRFVAIRPEMTPTLARMVANIHKQEQKPIRWYSIPNLMRYEKPQRGRLREHWQFNVDIFGAPQNLGEFEILSLIKNLMDNFGANNDMYSILINDRSIVDFVFNQLLCLKEEESYKLYKIIDKAKKVSSEKLDEMVNEVISEDEKRKIFKEYLALNSFEKVESFLNANNAEDISFLEFISLVKESDLNNYLEYDPTIVRGLDYYTGLVFEVFDKHPDNRRAIAGGGAYANLLQIFNETPLPGIGFGMGDVTLRDFLETHKLMPAFDEAEADLFICYFEDSSFHYANSIAQELRDNGIRVELNLGKIKFNKVFKVAQSKGHTNAAFIGEEEINNKTITLKNMQNRNQHNIAADNIAEMINFLKG